jgi:hypothetical protein
MSRLCVVTLLSDVNNIVVQLNDSLFTVLSAGGLTQVYPLIVTVRP